jgi:hypothetical protein
MDKLIKFLKSFGLNEQEVKKVLKEIPVDQSGLAGTNVAKGIFEKGGKEVSADYPLVTETMVSPFKLDKYKGLSREEALQKADEALNFLDKELTRTSNLIINQNLQLAPEQKINFANNLRMKREFEKEVEAFKTQPKAKIIKLETKQPVSKEGIEKLIEDAGQASPPGTMVGNIESKINILKSKAKEKGMTMDEILKETGESQVKFIAGQNEGYVRSMARQIMYNDIKSGKLKASKEIQDAVSGASNIDVIEPFRNIYGENALEQLDSLIPDIKNFANEIEAEKFVRSKYDFTPNLNRPKESYTPEEMEKILKEEPVVTDKKRKLTQDEIEDYEAELGEADSWLSEGTVEEAEKALKRRKQEYAYYYQQYKMGKLDPAPGEQTENRMKFLQKKLDEASITKDRRLINQNEIEELQELEDRFLANPDKRTTPKEPTKNEEQTKILTDFDIKDREPNARGGRIGYAKGGLSYLLGL